jgi:hypothetical protein
MTGDCALIELLISVCMASGGDCREVSFLYDAHDVSLMTCMVMAQSEAARWQERNPDWQISRWTCGFAGERGQSI